METFLYTMLGEASSNQDQSKVNTLGPFAMVLAYILSKTEWRGREGGYGQNNSTELYRGLNLSPD